MKFTEDATKLLEYVGGRENIKAVTHCVTRMRFVLLDEKKADVKKIEELPSAKGTFTQSGQFQVIIGNEVGDFYNEFTRIAGIEGVSKDAVKAEAKTNQTFLQRLMGNLAEIFSPLIPALICGGLLLGFRSVIGDIKMFDGKSLMEMSQFWAGVYDFLWLIGQAIFHFLPVGITWSITRKMGTTQILGIVLGLTLISPQLVDAYSVGTVPAQYWDFGFFQISKVGYQAQVIPAIMAGFLLVYLEKFWRKVTPEYVSMIVVPFMSLVPAVILSHFVIGPVGWQIGTWIADIVYAGLTFPVRWLFAGIFGLLYAPLVITGLHHMTNAIDMQLVGQYEGTPLWPMIALSNIAQGSAVLAMIILQRKDEKAKQINIPSCISCYLGVTEPALFGVNLKYGFPFVCGMIGSCLAAIVSISTGVTASSIGVGGIPGFLSVKPQFWLPFFAAMAVAIAVPFALTLLAGSRKLKTKGEKAEREQALEETPSLPQEENEEETAGTGEEFLSPMSGTVMDLSQVEDQAFASKAMGDGIAIELEGGEVKAPYSGKIVVLFPTKHAYGMKTQDGRELLIHIGMDTVQLNGKGFEPLVKKGDMVEQGQTLVKVDIDYIRSQGKSLVSPVIFTDGAKVESLKTGQKVQAGDKDMLRFL